MSADAASRVCEFVVKQIVDNPDGVSVAQSETDGGIRLDVSVADGDMGRVIGKRGRVASAIRTVVRAAGVDDEHARRSHISCSVASCPKPVHVGSASRNTLLPTWEGEGHDGGGACHWPSPSRMWLRSDTRPST